ncbi:MAG: hypothetical protein ACYTX0_38640 [Nostoc sp.]
MPTVFSLPSPTPQRRKKNSISISGVLGLRARGVGYGGAGGAGVGSWLAVRSPFTLQTWEEIALEDTGRRIKFRQLSCLVGHWCLYNFLIFAAIALSIFAI